MTKMSPSKVLITLIYNFLYLQAFIAVFLLIFRVLAICSYDIPNRRSFFAFRENF